MQERKSFLYSPSFLKSDLLFLGYTCTLADLTDLAKCPLTSQNSMKAWVYRELYIYGVYLHILRWNGRHYTVAIDNMQVREREFLFCMDLWFYL